MSAGPRRWRVYCSRWQPALARRFGFPSSCSWIGIRTADTAAQAAHGKCPRCGAPLANGRPA